jgi:hypothetical protein
MFLLKEPPKGLPQKIQSHYEGEKMNRMLPSGREYEFASKISI